MQIPVKSLILVLSIAAGLAADKDQPFKAGPVAGYANKQTNENVTIAAKPYDTEELAKAAFGKVNPNREGVLPVLVVIRNDTGKAISLEGLRAEYITPNRTKIEATPVEDLTYLQGPNRPDYRTSPIPGQGPRVKRRKNPLAGSQMSVRALAVQMLPSGEEASGFVYFQTGHRRGSILYLTGLRDATSGRELFYFEIPLDD
ncbi:MAG: hypothetical protein IPM24_10825 [Bryobacterales bacterium]|nr:hypothetical protein [Bryobacterales bacterium]